MADFLAADIGPAEYLGQIDGGRYDGFNLLLGDFETVHYATNRGPSPRALSAGIYGLSNGLLDTAWPKVEAGKRGLGEALSQSDGEEGLEARLLALLSDTTPADDHVLPDTGVGQDLERMLSPIYIESPAYGTRSSSVLIARRDGRVRITERQTHPEMDEPVVNRFEFQV